MRLLSYWREDHNNKVRNDLPIDGSCMIGQSERAGEITRALEHQHLRRSNIERKGGCSQTHVTPNFHLQSIDMLNQRFIVEGLRDDSICKGALIDASPVSALAKGFKPPHPIHPSL